MADEEKRVTIVAWPEEPARMEHRCDPDQPCKVSVSFEDRPLNVSVASSRERPIEVAMQMNMMAREPIPLCIKMCEPVCAQSDYTVGISIFDNPVAAVAVRGLTRLFNCEERPRPELTCVDFADIQPDTEFPQQFTRGQLVYTPLGDPLRASTIGEPAGQVKLAFPPSGLRIEFPGPADDVRITVNNYARPTINFAVFVDGTAINRFSEPISNAVKEVAIPQSGVTSVEITSVSNEASVVQVCYIATQPTPS
jgi:hypothetical protein